MKSILKSREEVIPAKTIKINEQFCPKCNAKITGIMAAASFSGEVDKKGNYITGHFRIGKCECGSWETGHNLEYSGENSINDNRVIFTKYKAKQMDI